MQTLPVTRRNFLKESLVIAGPVVAATTGPLAAAAAEAAPAPALEVCCIGAHPDDPESGCAGTLARYAQLGHSVTVVYEPIAIWRGREAGVSMAEAFVHLARDNSKTNLPGI